ncbi:Uncharacterised protein [Actinobacillus pleuropneumoniae]|nr:Uncharacterised protein [Actinobacillus pleuropneumoniae]
MSANYIEVQIFGQCFVYIVHRINKKIYLPLHNVWKNALHC